MEGAGGLFTGIWILTKSACNLKLIGNSN
jgi:hypothetical protein